jgi:hypothetical protein
VPISRERAVELSHRIAERIASSPGLSVAAEKEFTRGRILQALLDWDRESSLLEENVRKRLRLRTRGAVEGSREWDLLFAEEMTRALTELLGRGE